MPQYIGPVLATLRDMLMVSFVGDIFLLCFLFGIILKLLRGEK